MRGDNNWWIFKRGNKFKMAKLKKKKKILKYCTLKTDGTQQ